MHRWPIALALLAGPVIAAAQLPDSSTLSDRDRSLFRADIDRIDHVLDSAADKPAVTYWMARTWAAAKQWPEAMQWLRKAVEFRAGLDPSRDAAFAGLRGTREFDAILSAVREATPPVSHSMPAFAVAEGDLVPESIAYDPLDKCFYLGSMRKGKVVRCSPTGECTLFADGLGTVLGMKVHGRGLWLLNNTGAKAELIHYDVTSARIIRRFAIDGASPYFNDLVISAAGDVFLTDTRANAVWRLPNGASDLRRLPGRFGSANGIALSPDEHLLYISTFPDGITIVDLKTNAAFPILRPADLSLAAVDGLYCFHGALIAIQNGFVTPRVVRFSLSRNHRAIERFEILERRNPLFEGVTTGVVAGHQFLYMANIQDDKKAGFDPIRVLKLDLTAD